MDSLSLFSSPLCFILHRNSSPVLTRQVVTGKTTSTTSTTATTTTSSVQCNSVSMSPDLWWCCWCWCPNAAALQTIEELAANALPNFAASSESLNENAVFSASDYLAYPERSARSVVSCQTPSFSNLPALWCMVNGCLCPLNDLLSVSATLCQCLFIYTTKHLPSFSLHPNKL